MALDVFSIQWRQIIFFSSFHHFRLVVPSSKANITWIPKNYMGNQSANNATNTKIQFETSALFVPDFYVPNYFKRNSHNHKEGKKDSINVYAIKWPQDTIEDVVHWVSRNGTSPFPNESVTIYPDQILHDLKSKQEEQHQQQSIHSTDDYHAIWINNASNPSISLEKKKKQFWDYYNPSSLFNFDRQMAIASAIHLFVPPKVLIFGSGFDSPLICKAVFDIHPHGQVYFIENYDGFQSWSQLHHTLCQMSYSSSSSPKQQQFRMIPIHYDTILEHWMDWKR